MTGTDDLKNIAKTVEGKAKSAAGRATGNLDLEIDGEVERATAKARKNGEDESDLFGKGSSD